MNLVFSKGKSARGLGNILISVNTRCKQTTQLTDAAKGLKLEYASATFNRLKTSN